MSKINDVDSPVDTPFDKWEDAEFILKNAEEQAAGIINNARHKAEAFNLTISEKYRRKANELERQIKAEIERRSNKKILNAKKQLVNFAFTQALESLKSLPAEKRIRFLAKRLAFAGMNGGGEIKGAGSVTEWKSIIKASNEIITRTGSSYRLVLSKEQPEFDYGFLLIRPDYVINGSYEAIIQTIRRRIARRVYRVLFENEKRAISPNG
jgi:vacuolar-type H+-ATPase subunit E/Vma4